jgi:hypothetical protein
MPLRKGAAAQAAPPAGIESLARWQEWITVPGMQQAAADTVWSGYAFERHVMAPSYDSAGTPRRLWQTFGSITAFYRVTGEKQVLEFLPAIGASGANEIFYRFGHTGPGGTSPVDFHPTWGPVTEPAPAVPSTFTLEVMAWIRKRFAGDSPGARQFFGMLYHGDADFSRRNARVGLAGNAAGGFRFQSNNCPDAPAGAVQNLQADSDVNRVQPAVLIAPGVNWFHVRIKMIPATETQTGRILGFLNGRLVATFDQLANLPRASRSVADVLLPTYSFIHAVVAAWGDPDGVSQDAGFMVRDLRVRFSESWGTE